MAGECQRLLVERDVTVIGGNRPEQTRLQAWLDGHDGPMPSYRVESATRLGNCTCPFTATSPDMFEALVRLRRQLEPDGLMIAVQGTRRDTHPSGMARDMGGGMQVCVMQAGRRARGHRSASRSRRRRPQTTETRAAAVDAEPVELLERGEFPGDALDEVREALRLGVVVGDGKDVDFDGPCRVGG